MKLTLMLTMKTLLVSAVVAFFFGALFVNSKSISADSSASGAVKDGAKIYATSCARCHGADGRAKTGKGKQTNAVDLTNDDWEPNDARDTRIINNGKGKMPGFKKSLKPEEVQSVVVYIRKFKG